MARPMNCSRGPVPAATPSPGGDDLIVRLFVMLCEARRSSGTDRVALLNRVQRDLDELIDQAQLRAPAGLAKLLEAPPVTGHHVFERQLPYAARPTQGHKPAWQAKLTWAAGRKASGFDSLTTREREIIAHLVGGAANKEIARALAITDATVKVHIRTILRKLGLKNRTQVALYAVERTGPGVS